MGSRWDGADDAIWAGGRASLFFLHIDYAHKMCIIIDAAINCSFMAMKGDT